MLRTFDIILIAAMLVAATVTYKIKYDAEKQIAVINKLKSDIKHEEDTLRLLRADWSLLTQPGRLQALVEVYNGELALAPIEPLQIVSISDVPQRPLDDIDKIIFGSEELLAGSSQGLDMITTAGVKH